MKKLLIIIAVLLIVIPTVALGVVYRYDISYAMSRVKTIEFEESQSESIMTFNIRCISDADKGKQSWRYRARLVCDMLQDYQPSIICMQENKREQYEYLKHYLKGYESVATYRDDTPLTECLPIFYRADLYDLEQSSTFWLSDTPDEMSNNWESEYYRIFTYVVLKNKKTNKKFLVGNTHLDYKTEQTQEKSVGLIYNKIKDFNLPTMIMGDFNCTPDSKAISLAKQYFADVSAGFENENQGTVNYFKDDYPNVKADFIFQFENSFNIEKYEVVDKKYKGVFISDHFPVYVEVS